MTTGVPDRSRRRRRAGLRLSLAVLVGAVPPPTTTGPASPTTTSTRTPARTTPRTTRSKPRAPVTTTREVPNAERTDIASRDMLGNGRVYCEGPGAEETMSRYNG